MSWEGTSTDLFIACIGLSPKLDGEEGDAAESNRDGERAGVELPASQLSLLRYLDSLGKPHTTWRASGA